MILMKKTTKILLVFAAVNAALIYLAFMLLIYPKHEQLIRAADQIYILNRQINRVEEYAAIYGFELDTGALIAYNQIASELSQISALAARAGLTQTQFNATAAMPLTEIDSIAEVIITIQTQGTLPDVINYMELLNTKGITVANIVLDIEDDNLVNVNAILHLFAYF